MNRAQEILEAITERVMDYSQADYPVPDVILSQEKLATYLAELEERLTP